MRRREALFGLLVLVLVAALVGGDRIIPRVDREGAGVRSGTFLSTGWYCPVPSGEGVSALVVTANLGDEPVKLQRWAAGGAAPVFTEADLEAGRRTVAAASDLGPPGAVPVVEAFGARTVSDSLVLAGGAGAASSRCSVQPWHRWSFAFASTQRGRDTHVLLANPFEEEARVGIRVITPEEDTVPARLQEVLIPRLSQASVFLGDYFRETESFGLQINATRGRVIASRYSRVATRDGLTGLALDLGVREPSPRWFFAGGEVPTEGDEMIALVNPGEREALVAIIFQTDTEQLAQPALQEIAVPAGRQVMLRLAEHLPRATKHGIAITSVNQVPVVAERVIMGTIEGVRGVDAVLGVPATSRRWALSVGSPNGGTDALAVVNFGSAPAVVSVTLITEEGSLRPAELTSIPIGGGRRATIDLTPFLGGGWATAVVDSAADSIVVSHRLVLGNPFGDFADSHGIPL